MAYCGTVTLHEAEGDARALCEGLASDALALRRARSVLTITLLCDGAPIGCPRKRGKATPTPDAQTSSHPVLASRAWPWTDRGSSGRRSGVCVARGRSGCSAVLDADTARAASSHTDDGSRGFGTTSRLHEQRGASTPVYRTSR
jgi:hypothetical protein